MPSFSPFLLTCPTRSCLTTSNTALELVLSIASGKGKSNVLSWVLSESETENLKTTHRGNDLPISQSKSTTKKVEPSTDNATPETTRRNGQTRPLHSPRDFENEAQADASLPVCGIACGANAPIRYGSHARATHGIQSGMPECQRIRRVKRGGRRLRRAPVVAQESGRAPASAHCAMLLSLASTCHQHHHLSIPKVSKLLLCGSQVSFFRPRLHPQHVPLLAPRPLLSSGLAL